MYRKRFTIAITLVSFTVTSTRVLAQACCSAGPPLLGSLELSSVGEGAGQLAITYEYNSLRDLLDGSSTLPDETRRRTVHSVLLGGSYGLSSRVSATLLLTAVQQERRAEIFSGECSFLSVGGVGDAVVLIQYAVVPNSLPDQREITIGLGTKIPFGSSSNTDRGILLPADMQPGTGAWDGIAWFYASQGFLPTMPLTIYVVGSGRRTGTNERYGSGRGGYSFGDEGLFSLGAGYRTDGIMDYSLTLRARLAGADRFENAVVPNTGGLWLTAIPGLNFKIFDQTVLRGTFQFPIYRRLTGVQLTTSFVASAAVLYTFN